MTKPVSLEGGDGFVLRSLVESDRRAFVEAHALSREDFLPWMPEAISRQTPEAWFEQELARCQAEAHGVSEIRLSLFTQANEFVGLFALSQIFRGAFENAFASWRVASRWTGRGIGARGLNALLDIAFSSESTGLGLHRVQANVIEENKASVRVAEKAGFRREGVAKAYLKIDGRWQDHLMFAKLANEHLASR